MQKPSQAGLDSDISASTRMRVALHSTKEVNKYPAKTHCQRVGRTLGLEKCLIVLRGEKNQTFSNSDLDRVFRQDRYFYYLTGCNEPGCFVTYNVDDDKLVLWLPPINPSRVFWGGRGSTVEEAMDRYDIDEAYYITGGVARDQIARLLKSHHDTGGKCLFMASVGDILDQSLRAKLKGQSRPGIQLRVAMDACRAVKSEYEIDLIRKANEISAEAHINIMKHLHHLTCEPGVEAVYTATCIARGSKFQSYNPIIGSGPNASILHYMSNGDKFGDRQTLLVDAGAEWECYASDVTRTMPINPKKPGHWQTKEAEAVYRHVEKIQEECIARLGPGVYFLDLVFHSIHMSIDALLDLGILKGDHMDIFHNGVSSAFYPYGLGHHIGLEVHDADPAIEAKGKGGRFKGIRQAYDRFARDQPTLAAQYKSDDPRRYGINPSLYRSPCTTREAPLAPNMVVTVEPGIYFNEFALENFVLNDPERSKFVDREVLKRYMHVGGVRIEDDILITKDGYDNLTTTPKGKEMLQTIREAAKESR